MKTIDMVALAQIAIIEEGLRSSSTRNNGCCSEQYDGCYERVDPSDLTPRERELLEDEWWEDEEYSWIGA